MVKTWWIHRWYILYISVFTTLPNFRETCHEKFSVLHTFLDLMQTLNNLQTHYVRLSKTKLHSYYATFVYPILMPFLYLHPLRVNRSLPYSHYSLLFHVFDMTPIHNQVSSIPSVESLDAIFSTVFLLDFEDEIS
ncbi:hypothetical protein Hanom_Chr17g01547211 [Helianthus anomalus]